MVAAQQATLHAQVDQLQRLVVNPLAQEMVRSPSPFSNLCIVGSARSSARRSARPWCPSSRRGGRPRARAVVAVLELVPWWRAMGAAEDAVQQLGLLMELWDVVHRTCGRGGGAGVRALSRLHPEQLCILLQPELGSMTNLLDAQEYLLQEGCRPPSTRTSRDTCSSSSSLLSCT
ncbi:uncharacterized protein [Triticum aestivum]|uniref:uncharacterized protein isoform X2 n=1 Tax=Triticum aestivum TaxID=4565 RepID=UPI001D01774E|nr:uncharacterized protein LOC123158865 isoform X2 [Triticum aestivum]